MANAAKAKTQQKWKGIESKAKALAKQANEAHKKAKKLAEDALDQAQKAQEAYARRGLKGKGARPKLADLTPAQVVRGLGACNGHHTAGLPDDLEGAWNATQHKRWVLGQVSGNMSAAQRRRADDGSIDFSWAEVSKLLAKTVDFDRALSDDDKDFDDTIRGVLKFDPDSGESF